MKKIILMCLVFIFTNAVFAQSTKQKDTKVQVETVKKVKTNNASETGKVKSAEGKAKAADNKEEKDLKKKFKKRKTEEKAPKVKDKVTGKYKGKKVYTGSKGGQYYINKHGNKTYLEKKE